MPAIKDLAQSSDKWSRRASVASPDYASGVQNPRKSWAASSVAAEDSYKAGVNQAMAAGRYGKRIRRVGDQGWQSWTLAKGPSRYMEGVGLARPSYEAGFSPYHQAIASVTLPPRGPRGDIRNLERVKAVATVNRQTFEKLAQG